MLHMQTFLPIFVAENRYNINFSAEKKPLLNNDNL